MKHNGILVILLNDAIIMNYRWCHKGLEQVNNDQIYLFKSRTRSPAHSCVFTVSCSALVCGIKTSMCVSDHTGTEESFLCVIHCSAVADGRFWPGEVHLHGGVLEHFSAMLSDFSPVHQRNMNEFIRGIWINSSSKLTGLVWVWRNADAV